MRLLLNRWMRCGSAAMALALVVGCAPADKPKTEPAKPDATTPAPDGAATETPAAGGAIVDDMPADEAVAIPAEEEKPEVKDPQEAAPSDELEGPPDPVNLK